MYVLTLLSSHIRLCYQLVHNSKAPVKPTNKAYKNKLWIRLKFYAMQRVFEIYGYSLRVQSKPI